MVKILRNLFRHLLMRAQFCPVCEKSVTRFIPLSSEFGATAKRYGYHYFGQGETINVAEYTCPQCGAADRERLYALFLDQIIQIPHSNRRSKLVHFAPEPALSARIRHIYEFDYRTADLTMDGVDDHIDLTAMTAYPDSFCDAFICSHVLEHIADDRAALYELYRILKPGGWGILMVPLMTHLETSIEDPTVNTEEERWRFFGQGDHVRLYAKPDFLYRVAEVGFSIQQLGVDHFGADIFRRCGITPESVLYVVSHD